MEKMLTRLLALILACATATDASVNFSRYVPHRPSKVPIAPMGKCLVDMSISILIFNDVGAASIYQPGVSAI